MARIAILMPLVWSVRNVLHSGVLRALSNAGIEAHIIARPWRRTLTDEERRLLLDAAAVHTLIEPAEAPPRGKALLDELTHSAFQQQRGSASYAIYRPWFTRHDRGLLRLRRRLVDAAGRAAASPRGVRLLNGLVDRLVRRTRDIGPVRAQLQAIDPDLIWSTVNISGLEQSYRFAARDLGVPVATSILSFDNLTSRGPLARDDWYLVWSERMKAQLRRVYPQVPEPAIEVTGSAQFDFHRQAACLWPRARMLRELGLSSSSSYFLYAGSHAMLTPDEPALVSALAARMTRRALLANRALVVRLHPLDDPARWRSALVADARLRVMPAFAAARIEDGWTVDGSGPLSIDDQARLVSAVSQADACLNIASTMTLDAAVLDRPVICLDFRDERAAPRDLLFAEYGAEHYAPLVASGGLRLAHGWSELLDLMEAAVIEPSRDHEARARMAAEECGLVDGHASERIARVLTRLARESAQRRTGAGAGAEAEARGRAADVVEVGR